MLTRPTFCVSKQSASAVYRPSYGVLGLYKAKVAAEKAVDEDGKRWHLRCPEMVKEGFKDSAIASRDRRMGDIQCLNMPIQYVKQAGGSVDTHNENRPQCVADEYPVLVNVAHHLLPNSV